MRSGLPHHRDEVNAVRISHYASVVLVCFGPFAIEVPVGGDVVVHYVYRLLLHRFHLVIVSYRSYRSSTGIKLERGTGPNGSMPINTYNSVEPIQLVFGSVRNRYCFRSLFISLMMTWIFDSSMNLLLYVVLALGAFTVEYAQLPKADVSVYTRCSSTSTPHCTKRSHNL